MEGQQARGMQHNLQNTYRTRRTALGTLPSPITPIRKTTQAPSPHFYSSHPGFWRLQCSIAPQFPLKQDHLFNCSTHHGLDSHKATMRLHIDFQNQRGKKKKEQDGVKSFSHKSFWHIFLSLSVHVINLLSFQERLRFFKNSCNLWSLMVE